MRRTILHFLSLSLLAVTLTKQDEPLCAGLNDDTLVFVHFTFRHGDRTPWTTYPTDPYDENYWNKWGGLGQLIQPGMEHHYQFGQWVRGCYGSFLNDTYNPRDLYVRSTDYDRTLESAESHLAGAYPPKDWQQWSDIDLAKLWQPIPIHTIPKAEDYVLVTDMKCPPYDALIDEVWATSPRIKAIQTEYQALLDYMAEKAGLAEGDLNLVTTKMCDAVYVERLMNLTLPTWINETIVQKLEDWMNIWIMAELANDEMIRYAGGQLIYTMQNLMRNKTKGLIPQKHYIFSAHDTTVSTLLAAYDDWDKMGPPYRAAVITELHQNKQTKEYFVRAFYRNNITVDPRPLSVRKCDLNCPLDQYITLLDPVSLPDKKKTCYTPISTGLDEGAMIAIGVTSALVVILVIATVIFLLLPTCRKPQGEPTNELVN